MKLHFACGAPLVVSLLTFLPRRFTPWRFFYFHFHLEDPHHGVFLLTFPTGKFTPWRFVTYTSTWKVYTMVFFTYFPTWKIHTMAFFYLLSHLEGLHHGVFKLTFPPGRFTKWCTLLTFPPKRFTPRCFFTYISIWKVYTMVFFTHIPTWKVYTMTFLYLHFHLEGLHYDGFLLLVSYPTADATHIDSPKPLTHQNH
jgi:hypothetical protein